MERIVARDSATQGLRHASRAQDKIGAKRTAMTADFAQLYAQLGLRADCSLDEFRRACRRRIAELHPDRLATGTVVDTTQIPLSELLGLYAKAVRFHRKHGRLPGATPAPVAQAAPARSSQLLVPLAAPGDDVRRASLRGPLILVLAIVVILFALSSRDDGLPVVHPPARLPIPAKRAIVVEPVADQLEIGMQPAQVRAIQGEPMRADELQWEYGPSWLRFEHNRLVDWYSSPMHPLKTASASPPPEPTSL